MHNGYGQLTPGGQWAWLLGLSEQTQLCIVTDPSVTDAAAAALVRHFAAVPQVAMLRIHDPVSLHRAWIATSASACDTSAAAAVAKPAQVPLQHVSRALRLLIWSRSPETLDWLSSVQGHAASYMRHGLDAMHEGDDPAAVEAAIEQVRAAFRAVVQSNLGAGA